MSWLSLRPDVSNPHLDHVWRGNAGEVFAIVKLGKDADMVLASAADAPQIATAPAVKIPNGRLKPATRAPSTPNRMVAVTATMTRMVMIGINRFFVNMRPA